MAIDIKVLGKIKQVENLTLLQEDMGEESVIVNSYAGEVVENLQNTINTAKGSSASLGERLDGVDTSLADIMTLPLSRFVNKMLSGANVKITFLGDSILEGTTASAPGTNDCASLVCSKLSTRFGVTVTKNNLAVSGDRAYLALIGVAKFEKAITDASDLIVISYGHNDLMSDFTTPGTGYPKASMAATIEHMIRRIRRELPNCDIVLLTENPYQKISGSNALLVAQNDLIKPLVSRYNIALADGYATFTNLADWDSYLSDGAHPNSAGHLLLAETILELFDTTDYKYSVSNVRPILPEPLNNKVKTIKRQSWTDITAVTSGTIGQAIPKYLFSGTWVGSVANTAGAAASCRFWGNECALKIICGADTAVVDIYVDGILVHNDLDLSAYPSNIRYLPLVNLGVGYHNVYVVLVSGSLDFRGFVCQKSNCELFNINDSRITFNGTWADPTTTTSFFFESRRGLDPGCTLEFDFYGTGVSLESFTTTFTNRGFTVTVDGIEKPNVTGSASEIAATITTPRVLVSGLEFGKHHIVIGLLGTVGQAIGGFLIHDGIVTP